MLSACMILLLYPLIADIRKSRFYIGPVLICTLILMGIGIVRGKITLFSVLTGWIPGMMMVMMSRWTNGKIGEGDGIVVASVFSGVFSKRRLWTLVDGCKKKRKKQSFPVHSFFVYGCTVFFVFRAMKGRSL